LIFSAFGECSNDLALRKWIMQARIDQEAAPDVPLTTEERQGLASLRREVKRLEQERSFLKKAAAFCCARTTF
jgi:transposase